MVLEKLFRAEITLAAPQELGETPQGRRRIIGITGIVCVASGARRAAAVEPDVFEIK